MSAEPEIRRSVEIAAPPERVWQIVTDLPAMGELSPENRGGRWVGGASGPAAGARFRGVNRRGLRRWSTTARVVQCDPPTTFAFDVDSYGQPVAHWRFDIEPTGTGCRVTESWRDRRTRAFAAVAGRVTGVRDRQAFTPASIEHTLERLKARAEAAPPR